MAIDAKTVEIIEENDDFWVLFLIIYRLLIVIIYPERFHRKQGNGRRDVHLLEHSCSYQE